MIQNYAMQLPFQNRAFCNWQESTLRSILWGSTLGELSKPSPASSAQLSKPSPAQQAQQAQPSKRSSASSASPAQQAQAQPATIGLLPTGTSIIVLKSSSGFS